MNKMSDLDAIMKLVDDKVNLQVDNELLRLKALPLGELIEKLKGLTDHSKRVYTNYMGGGNRGLFEPHSYRGFYRMLALEPEIYTPDATTVYRLISMLENCIGKEFEGYKGGTYRMDEDSWVFVSPHGIASEQVVVDVEEKHEYVEIKCKTHDPY